jgi:uncharacterized protein (TIGR00288 family)
MSNMPPLPQRRVALLIDCDNAGPAMLPFALERIRSHGKVSIRRGYGGRAVLGGKWKEAMMQGALTPHLHYSAVSGKNTSDIALALDAFELAMNAQVEMVCIVTSDADYVYLCTKLRERGILSCVIGESKTPPALRAASDYFHEFAAPAAAAAALEFAKATPPAAAAQEVHAARKLLTAAVRAMLKLEGLDMVSLPKFGQFLRQAHPTFSYKEHHHANLSKMLMTVPMLECRLVGDDYMVSLRSSAHDRCSASAVSG